MAVHPDSNPIKRKEQMMLIRKHHPEEWAQIKDLEIDINERRINFLEKKVDKLFNLILLVSNNHDNLIKVLKEIYS